MLIDFQHSGHSLQKGVEFASRYHVLYLVGKSCLDFLFGNYLSA